MCMCKAQQSVDPVQHAISAYVTPSAARSYILWSLYATAALDDQSPCALLGALMFAHRQAVFSCVTHSAL